LWGGQQTEKEKIFLPIIILISANRAGFRHERGSTALLKQGRQGGREVGKWVTIPRGGKSASTDGAFGGKKRRRGGRRGS